MSKILDNLSKKLGKTVEDATVTGNGVTTNYGSTLSGTIDLSGVTVVNITVPLTNTYVLVMNSTNPTIYFSLDYGTTDNFYTPANPVTGDNQIYAVMNFPVTQIVFLGNEGDTWYIV